MLQPHSPAGRRLLLRLVAWGFIAGLLVVGSWSVVSARDSEDQTRDPAAVNAVGITATKRDSLLTDANNNGQVNPGDTIRYTLVVTNAGSTDATGVSISDTLDPNTTLVGTVRVAPLAVNDSYTAIGNTYLAVGTTTPAPHVTVAGSVFDNDSDFLGQPCCTLLSYDTTSAQGGSVIMFADGTFLYLPPVGFGGNMFDTFTYRIIDSDGLISQATVRITVNERVWYVDGSAPAGGDGRAGSPFTSLDPLNSIGDPDGVNDYIYLYPGSYDQAMRLESSQRFIGAGVDLVVAGTTLVPASSAPLLEATAGAAITLADNNTISGLNIGNTAAGSAGIFGNAFGTLTVSTVAITGTGRLLDLNTGTLNASFLNLSTTSASNTAINLQSLASGSTLSVPTVSISGLTSGFGVLFTQSADTAVTMTSLTVATTSASTAVSLANNSGTTALQGTTLAITTTSGAGLSTNSGGTISFSGSTSSINATGGPAIDSTSSSVTLTLQNLSAQSSPTTGVSLVNTSGSLVATGGTLQTITGTDVNIDGGAIGVALATSITNTAGRSVVVANRTALNTSVTLSGPLNDTGTGILINNNSNGATITFSNATKTLNTGTSAAVTLTSNAGATITFANGGLNITTTSGAGFSATGGGTVSVTGSANVIATGAGQALNLNTITNNGITFRSISSNGAATAINLATVSGTGAFAVTGTGTAGSGGTIQNNSTNGFKASNAGNITLQYMNFSSAGNTNGASCDNATNSGCNAAINLSSANTVTLDNLAINNSAQVGINGLNVNGLTISSVTATNCGAEVAEACLRMVNLNGSALIINSTFAVGGERNFWLNNTSGALTMTISGSTFRDTQSSPTGADGIEMDFSSSATATIVINGSSFLRNKTNGVQVLTDNSAIVAIDITNSTFDPGTGSMIGVDFGANNTSRINFNVNSNTITSRNGSAVNVTAFVSGRLEGRINGNTIQTFDTSLDGTFIVIRAALNENSTGIVAIQNNTINAVPAGQGPLEGILVDSRLGAGTTDAIISNNVLTLDAARSLYGIETRAQDSNVNCSYVHDNSVSSFSSRAYRVRQASGTATMRLQNFVTDATTTINTNGNTPLNSVSAFGTITGGTCTAPSNPLPRPAAAHAALLEEIAAKQLSEPEIAPVDGMTPELLQQMVDAQQGVSDLSAALPADVPAIDTAALDAIASRGLTSVPVKVEPSALTTPPFPINIGTLPAGASITLIFDAQINTPLPAGVETVQNQASISGSNFSTVLSNDPDTVAANDPTLTTVVAAPNLGISKSDGNTSAAPGDTIAYTLAYSNTGDQGATGVTLSETVPANTTFNAGASSAGWSCPNGAPAATVCTLTVGALNVGANGTRTFAVTVVNPVPAGVSQISNTATIADDTTSGPDPVPGNNTSTDTTPVNAAPDLAISKTDGTISVVPGQTFAYTLTFTNTGNQGASGVTLSETVPLNTTFNAGASSAGWSCANGAPAGSTCTLAVGGLAGGNASTTRLFAVTVDAAIPNGVTQTSNTVTISDDGTNGADPTPGNNTASDTTPIIAGPDMVLSKSDGGASVVPGGTVAYTLAYSNAGNQAAAGVVLTETVPLNTTFNAGTSTPGWSCVPNNNAGSTCTFNVGAVAVSGGGSVTFAVTVVNPVGAGVNQITNTATIYANASARADLNPADNTASDTTTVNAAPDLSITKSDGGASVTPGQTVAYTLTYSNIGNQDATGVVITESVPLNTTFNAGASSAGWSCANGAPAGSTCTLSITALGVGASGSRLFAVTVVNPVAAGVNQLSNTVRIDDDGTNGPDPAPGNNTATDTTSVNAAPDLTLTKTDGNISAVPGQTFPYTLTLANAGNQGATGVVLSETVPLYTTFNAGASSPGWSCAPDNNAGSTCTLAVGALTGGGASVSRRFAVTVVPSLPAGVTVTTNTATVSDDGTNSVDPTPGNNTASDTTPLVAAPDLVLSKFDDGSGVGPLSTIIYTLAYTNTGTRGATNVVLTETVPVGSTFNAGGSSPGWSCAPNNNPGSTCTINIGSLNVGQSGSKLFVVLVGSPVAAGLDQIVNTASIGDDGSNGADLNPADNTSTDTTPIYAAPNLSLSKTDGGASVIPGGTVAYTLTYANIGNQHATGVIITETVPLHTTFNAGASSAGWSCANGAPAGSTCTLSIGALNAGVNSARTFAVTVLNPVDAGVNQLSNTASIADDGTNGPDPAPGNNTAADTTTVIAAPDLTLSKTDGDISAVPGQTFPYTLTLSNVGNQGATGVIITETVPLHTTFNAGASSPGWSCAPNNNAGSTCTLTVGALAGGGASTTRRFAVTVVPSLPAGVTQTTNTASLSDDGANGADPTPANNTASDTTPLIAAPDLVLSKSDGGASVTPGGTVAYTLAYTNTGTRGATTVVLTETVPANTTFNAGASSAGWTCAPNNNAGATCTLAVGALNVGQSDSKTFAVTVVNPVAAGVNQLSNTARIGDDGTNGMDPTPANNTASDTTTVNAVPELSITKSDGGASAAPGVTVAYTLTYANTGNQGATGVVLSETVPLNSSFNTGASSAGWSCANGAPAGSTCTLSITALAAGGSGARTFAVTVVNPVPAGVSQLSNTASIGDDTTNGTDPVPGNNTASDSTPINAAPDLTLTKTDGNISAAPGQTVAYTLTVTNVGNQGATGVVLSETVPLNSSFNAGASSAGWSCANGAPAGTTCTLAVGALTGGGTVASRTFAVIVNAPIAAGVTQLSNTAAVTDDGTNGADPTPANNTAADTTPITSTVDLVLAKTDGGISAVPGQTVAYTLTVTNAGNQLLTGVVITERVPLGSTFNAGASTPGWSCADGAPGNTTCTFNYGNARPASQLRRISGAAAPVIFAVTVVDPAPAGIELLENSASVADDGSNGVESTPADNTAADTTPVIATVDLSITKTDGGISAVPGQTVVYTLTVTNTGDQDASGVFISETVPLYTTFNAGASSAGWVCTPDGSAGSTCRLPAAIAGNGGSTAVQFAVTVANPVPSGVTQIDNTVLTFDEGSVTPDPTPGDNTAADSTPISAAPDLSLTKTDGGITAVPGQTFAYTLTVTNSGDQDANKVTLTETVPLYTTFNAGASTAGWVCTPDGSAGSTCVFPVGPLTGAGGFTAVQFAVTVASPLPAGVTETTNTASVGDDGSNGVDPTPADNTAADTTPLDIFLDLSISKSAQPAVVAPGALITYTITLTSAGDGIVDGVRITDTLPANVALTSVISTGLPFSQISTSPLVWQVDGLAPNQSGSLILVAQVDAGLTSEGPITNTVSVGHPAEDVPANNTATAVVIVNQAPTADAGGPYTVDEGSPVVLSAAGSADPGDDIISYAWDRGNNGSYETFGITTTFTNTPDDAVHTIGLLVTDEYSATDSTVTTVTVLNVAPTVNVGPDLSARPNQSVQFTGVFTDPGVLDTHTFAWDFGDNATLTGTLTPTHAYSLPGTYTVTLTVTDDDNGVGVDTLIVNVRSAQVFLPLLLKPAAYPDLVVERITPQAGTIEVIIRNVGTAPATDPFWIDLYLNPSPAPTMVNQIWSDLSQYGAVWGINSDLPLNPGASLTLQLNDARYRPEFSALPATIPAGTAIYAQVDSSNDQTTYGAVLELHEAANLPYNNITGIVTSTPITPPAARDSAPTAPTGLPERPQAVTSRRSR